MCLAYATYDTHENSKKKCQKFIQLIEENNFKRSYGFLNDYVKKQYAFAEFSSLIETIKHENSCINYECTKVNSGDNFNLLLTSCNNNITVLVITFGGGWGFGWKVVNIRKKL